MPALKPNTILPTIEEDEAITAAALSDADSVPLTDSEWRRVQSKLFNEKNKEERIALKLSNDVISAFKTMGQDWTWLQTHHVLN